MAEAKQQSPAKRTGAPDYTWLHACQYLAAIHNITADETLSWETPWHKWHMETPDISAYLQFLFWECIYYYDDQGKYPSTKQKATRWVGVADNVGNKMTFCLITEDTEQEIQWSVVIPAHLANDKNISWDPALDTADPNTAMPLSTEPQWICKSQLHPNQTVKQQ